MPYQIDPGTNPGGEEFEAYNRRRWGGSGWTRRLIEEGRRDGANFADWRWWPSTLKAHQLVRYAEERLLDYFPRAAPSWVELGPSAAPGPAGPRPVGPWPPWLDLAAG